MSKERKRFARYIIVRGLHTMWAGNPSENGSRFREFVVTSDECFSTQGALQVYGLEGVGKGIKDGKFAASDDAPKVLFDEDFNGLDAAVAKFKKVVEQARAEGFTEITLLEALEFEAKLQRAI